MPKFLIILLTLAVVGGWGAPASAADRPRCLSPEQRRAAIANKQAIPLGRVVRAVRGRIGGDVVRARLCEGNPGLVYMLTLLARNGKVTRATVDATNGQLLSGR